MDQEKIGKLIAKLRKSKGLTQRELGEMVGVGFRAVSKWETGLTSPDISIINDLSKILGISADELLKGEVKEKAVLQNKKIKNKNIIYTSVFIIIIIILTLITIIINNNRSHIYELATYDKQYYIEGEILFRKNNISLKITKLGFEDNEFRKTLIKNYQYDVTSDDTFIVGYGYIPTTTQLLPKPVSIEAWADDFHINYDSDIDINEKKMTQVGLKLRVTLIDNENNVIKKEIKIYVKRKK